MFLVPQARHNILTKPDATSEEISHLSGLLPRQGRHKWFRSMNSSQALAQSVFGNLALYNHLTCLAELSDDEGEPLFGKAQVSPQNFVMEHKINHLGEPRRTSLDGFIAGNYQVAIECKFTEAEVGCCSRPLLKPSDSNYGTDFCNGNFTQQLSRTERCPLTEIGVLYWRYVSELFEWPNEIDLIPILFT